MSLAIDDEEIAIEVNGNHPLNVIHPLVPTWKFWVWKSDSDEWKPEDKRSGNLWLNSLHEQCAVKTIEDFWALYHRIIPPSGLSYGTDYIYFKEGIEPKWEDPENENGGIIYVDVEKVYKHTKLNRYWLELLAAILGGQFDEYNKFITGAVVNIRVRGDKLCIWLGSADADVIRAVQEKIDSKLGLTTTDRIYFKKHQKKISA